MVSEVKSCPQCGEEILAVAIKCKHCQSVLGDPPPPPPLTSASVAAPRPQGDPYGTVLLLAP